MNKPSLPIFQYIVFPDIILVLLISAQAPVVVRFVGFCIYTYLSASALSFTAGNATQDYFIGFILSSQFLLATQLLWLVDPVKELRHKRDTIPVYRLSVWRRIYWAFCLDHSVRAIGWTHQVQNVPPSLPETRWYFVKSRLLRAAIQLLVSDMANVYILLTAATSGGTPTLIYGFISRCSTIVAWIVVTCGTVNVQYYTLAILSVGSGASFPEDWPDVFGNWSEAYTLRNFWSKVWHQNLRRIFTPFGRFAVHSLGFKRGTKASSYTQLFVAFFLSGFIHSVGDAMVSWKYAGSSMPFFLIQAVAIAAEDAVIAHFRKIEYIRARGEHLRALGYIWVFLWGVLTFSYYRDLAIKAGWGWSSEWPVSLARFFWEAILLQS